MKASKILKLILPLLAAAAMLILIGCGCGGNPASVMTFDITASQTDTVIAACSGGNALTVNIFGTIETNTESMTLSPVLVSSGMQASESCTEKYADNSKKTTNAFMDAARETVNAVFTEDAASETIHVNWAVFFRSNHRVETYHETICA